MESSLAPLNKAVSYRTVSPDPSDDLCLPPSAMKGTSEMNHVAPRTTSQFTQAPARQVRFDTRQVRSDAGATTLTLTAPTASTCDTTQSRRVPHVTRHARALELSKSEPSAVPLSEAHQTGPEWLAQAQAQGKAAVKQMDANKDGVVDQAEFAANGGTKEDFNRYDLNGDNVLDARELALRAVQALLDANGASSPVAEVAPTASTYATTQCKRQPHVTRQAPASHWRALEIPQTEPTAVLVKEAQQAVQALLDANAKSALPPEAELAPTASSYDTTQCKRGPEATRHARALKISQNEPSGLPLSEGHQALQAVLTAAKGALSPVAELGPSASTYDTTQCKREPHVTHHAQALEISISEPSAVPLSEAQQALQALLDANAKGALSPEAELAFLHSIAEHSSADKEIVTSPRLIVSVAPQPVVASIGQRFGLLIDPDNLDPAKLEVAKRDLTEPAGTCLAGTLLEADFANLAGTFPDLELLRSASFRSATKRARRIIAQDKLVKKLDQVHVSQRKLEQLNVTPFTGFTEIFERTRAPRTRHRVWKVQWQGPIQPLANSQTNRNRVVPIQRTI